MRLAINGYGRIGRSVLRAALQRSDCVDLDFVAINELASPEAVDYLTRYDSTHGRFPGEVVFANNHLSIQVGSRKANIDILQQGSQSDEPWKNRDIDMVLDCSGTAETVVDAKRHLESGAGRVLLSRPGQSCIPAIVYGINHADISLSDKVHSAASCTSNALIPCLSVLHQCFGIDNGVITTIHASMHDQPVIDAYHSDDLRKNRGALQSIIPVDTELALGIGRIIPTLSGRFVAHALRVPVNNVSALNVTVNLGVGVSKQEVNRAFEEAACGKLKGIIGYTEEPLASCDFNGDTRSGVIDSRQTAVSGDRTANLLIWFDNEWAFANRMLDIVLTIAAMQALK